MKLVTISKIFAGIFLVILLPVINMVNAADNISAAFKLSVNRGESPYKSSGLIHFNSEVALTVHVTDPLEQWMIFKGDTLTIYYPVENEIIKMPSRSGEVTLPIFQLIINSGLEDLGLVQVGYSLKKTDLDGEKITATWEPPTAAQKVLGELIATYVRDSLISIVAYNPKNKVVSRQIYSNYLASKGKIFPRDLKVTRYGKTTDSVFESISLENVVFDIEIPEELLNPAMPDSVKTTVIEW